MCFFSSFFVFSLFQDFAELCGGEKKTLSELHFKQNALLKAITHCRTTLQLSKKIKKQFNSILSTGKVFLYVGGCSFSTEDWTAPYHPWLLFSSVAVVLHAHTFRANLAITVFISRSHQSPGLNHSQLPRTRREILKEQPDVCTKKNSTDKFIVISYFFFSGWHFSPAPGLCELSPTITHSPHV